MSRELHFGCTQCGRCCQGPRLPLTLAEAHEWVRAGHPLEVLCEAVAWPAEPAPGDAAGAVLRRRTTPALSGRLPIRVMVTLTTATDGACPYLQADNLCGQYATRPLVCRIYPAEVNPLLPLDPARKLCPDEAWAATRPLYSRGGVIVDAGLQALVARWQQLFEAERFARAWLCHALALDEAAVRNDGLLFHRVDAGRLRAALEAALTRAQSGDEALPPGDWTLRSHRDAMVSAYADVGARSASAAPGVTAAQRYLVQAP